MSAAVYNYGMRALGLTAALLAGSLLGGGTAEGVAGAPRTLVLAKGPIAAFAQDGRRIAWASADPGPGCVWRVRVRDLAAGRQYRVNTDGGSTCRSDTGFDLSHPTSLALARERALWTLFDQGNNTYIRVVTGAPGAGREVVLEELVHANSQYEEGDHLSGLAGDAGTLVYGKVGVGVQGPPDCDIEDTCDVVLDGGGVQRVSGGAAAAVPVAPPPVAVAASGGRIALVVARVVGPPVGAGAPARVEIRNATSGALVSAFVPAGRPVAVALSGARLALLVRAGAGRRILRYSTAGALLGSRSVPSTVNGISMSGGRVVFSVGRSIRLWSPSRAVTTLATAAAAPIGVSIEGARVAWAENVTVAGTLRGRVRALTLY